MTTEKNPALTRILRSFQQAITENGWITCPICSEDWSKLTPRGYCVQCTETVKGFEKHASRFPFHNDYFSNWPPPTVYIFCPEKLASHLKTTSLDDNGVKQKVKVPIWNHYLGIVKLAVDSFVVNFVVRKGADLSHDSLWITDSNDSHGYPAHDIFDAWNQIKKKLNDKIKNESDVRSKIQSVKKNPNLWNKL